jgi:fructose-specific phosphotransferase system IIC component
MSKKAWCWTTFVCMFVFGIAGTVCVVVLVFGDSGRTDNLHPVPDWLIYPIIGFGIAAVVCWFIHSELEADLRRSGVLERHYDCG